MFNSVPRPPFRFIDIVWSRTGRGNPLTLIFISDQLIPCRSRIVPKRLIPTLSRNLLPVHDIIAFVSAPPLPSLPLPGIHILERSQWHFLKCIVMWKYQEYFRGCTEQFKNKLIQVEAGFPISPHVTCNEVDFYWLERLREDIVYWVRDKKSGCSV